MRALDQLRSLGATVVIDDTILPESFARIASRVGTHPYVRQGTELFLKDFGPAGTRRLATTPGRSARRCRR